MVDQAREEKVIKAFCDRLSVLLREPCSIKEWLKPPNCEAILDRAGKSWAIDHTVLNSFKNQKADDAIFNAVATPLEAELKVICGNHFVRVLIPVGGLSGNKAVLRKQLRASLERIIPMIPDDDEFHHVILKEPKCELDIARDPSEDPLVGCYMSRLLPPNHRKELEDDLKRAIQDKSRQLTSYRRGGKSTVLLLDTREISSFNEFSVAKAFAAAAGTTDHSQLDEIFLFDEPTLKFMIWPLKFRGILPPDMRWIYEFRRAQAVLVWGMKHKGLPYLTGKSGG
jgi:hypothetical protein